MSATLRFQDCLEWELGNETCQLHWICSGYLCRAVLNVSEKICEHSKGLWTSLSYALSLVRRNQHNCSSEDLLLCVTHLTLQIKIISEMEQSFPLGVVVIEMVYEDYSQVWFL